MSEVHRLPVRIVPDPKRVISRPFSADAAQTSRRIERVLTLSEDQTRRILTGLLAQYGADGRDISAIWMEHYALVERFLPSDCSPPSREQRLLIGAYFTMEYALEAAALCNPSIVPALDQTGVPPGSLRFVISLRAIGEGHISSIVIRRGVIDSDNNITLETPAPACRALTPIPDTEFETAILRETLSDLGALGPLEELLLGRIGETFSMDELNNELERSRADAPSYAAWEKTRDNLHSLIGSNYKMRVPEGLTLGEAVLFPASQNESHGIEDLRLVRFTDDDGSVVIYGTYTAFNGFTGFPTLLQLRGRDDIQCYAMAGRYSRNKGMALFPRKISGEYVMSGRLDGENLYILESDNVLVWNDGRLSQEPKYWWEYSIIGNCGSPIETSDGWLLLTHGVGPMRQYCIGAALLDLDDPAQVIGRTKEPLILPADDERVGYVPNVVYTCGSMIYNDSLIIPYAMSDMITTFAYIDLHELLSELISSGP